MITVVGEALVDLIADEPHPGGSPANVAVALARLGRPVRLLTQLGGDAYGDLLRGYLRDNGVELAAGSLVDAPRTSTARTRLSADGQASYEFDIGWRRFDPPGLDAPACLHTGSLATALSPGANAVLAMVRALRPYATISFDPNCRPSLVDDRDSARDRVEAMVAESDIVKASLDDLAWLYPGRAHEDAAREWLERGARLVVVTLGGDGAWAGTPHRSVAVRASPVTVVDTVGAGDAFMAGLLFALGEAKLLGQANPAGDRKPPDAATPPDGLKPPARPTPPDATTPPNGLKPPGGPTPPDATTPPGTATPADGPTPLDPARRAELAAIDEPVLTGLLAFASRVAAITCTRRGADPPTLAELNR